MGGNPDEDALGATTPSHEATVKLADGRRDGDYPGFLPVDPQHYVLAKEIARGGMGRIRVARDRRLGREVALKEMIVKGGDVALRFEREARITARLEHPSIMSVHEAGTWPSGEPFYTMRLVTGRSLDVVVAEATTLEQRLALLPNVLAVADAMAFAHDAGVIHRDLKPNNVLVGAFGETVVIDWGLAKELEDTTPDVAIGSERNDAAQTQAGVVMGTPAFMSPEQARGTAVDARADVYSIGAILDYVLTGKLAYNANQGAEIVEALKRRGPAPITQRQPGVPPDLVAILERAMARDPAARYPTARELAEDLRRYQTGQLVGAHRYSLGQLLRRWVRRHRATVAVGAAALVAVAVIGTIAIRRIIEAQQQAETQREYAERSRRDAEELVGFMVVDLKDKLKPLGRLDLLDAAANHAISYYGHTSSSGIEATSRRALAQRNIGDVLAARGESKAALVQYRTSLAVFAAVAALDVAHPHRQREVANGHVKVGDALRERGIADGALAEFRTALAVTEVLAAREPANTGWQHDLSLAHERIGVMQRVRGDRKSALAEHRAALALAKALVAKDPKNDLWSRGLASSYAQIATLTDDPKEEHAASLAALEIRERLAADKPHDAVLERDVSVSREQVGAVLFSEGDADGALAQFRAARVTDEKAAAADPTDLGRLRDLSVIEERIGEVLLERNDIAGALAEYQASLAIAETLAKKDPTNATAQSDLSVAQETVGGVLVRRGDSAGALAMYQASFAIREQLVAKDPASSQWREQLGVSYVMVGDVLLARGDKSGALAKYRGAFDIFERLDALDPSNDSARDLSVSHEKLGDALLATHKPTAAAEHYKAGLALAQKVIAQDPASVYMKHEAETLAKKLGSLRRH